MRSLREFLKSLKRPEERSDKGHERETEGPKPEESGVRRESRRDAKAHGPLIRRTKEKVHIQVGLDFGTSSTKAVYSHVGRRLSRAVCFSHDLPNYPRYCLPSLAAINNRGQLLLGTDAARFLADREWDSGFQRFKVIVAGKYDEVFRDSVTEENFHRYLDENHCADRIAADELTALYLAHSMKECRELIEKSPDYRDVELDIAFNICMPIDHIQNNVVNGVFRRIFSKAEGIESAWRASAKGTDLWGSLQGQGEGPQGSEKRVFAIPEAVAAMASYLVSLRKQPGRHAIIDFGAGTTDVSICNLSFQTGQSISYWYAARNIPKGTIGVERVVVKHISECSGDSSCSCCEVTNFLERLAMGNVQTPGDRGESRSLYDNIHGEIRSIRDSKVYSEAWGNAYSRLRKQSAWENVEIFLTGGGASLPFVKGVFSVPWWKNLHIRYPVNSLPTPDDYHPGDGDAPFNRMSVAYGLARPKPEFDDYILPSDVGDHTPPLPPLRKGPDRDDLYPE